MKKILRPFDKKGFYISLLLFITAQTVALSQVKFSAVCPNKKIGRSEYLQVQYVVENAANVEEINPPSFKNFSVVSGPNQQSSTSIINGAVSQSIALEFILKPGGTGTFTLPPATAKVNGRTLISNSLTVQVTNSSSGSSSGGGTAFSPFGSMMADAFAVPSVHQYDDYILRKGENVNEKIKKNLFVKVDVNKTSCYVGEPVVATYKLYTRLKSESNLTKSPSFNGFSVSEMKMRDNYGPVTEKYNGREYSVYILRKVQLYPLQAGTAELDPVEVDNRITFIKADYAAAKNGDIFEDMMRDFSDASTPAAGVQEEKVTLQSKPLSILVKPLPEINKPADFKGAVGSFSMQANVEKNAITADEAGNLYLTISGSGNIQMINAPGVAWPEGIEAYDAKTNENIDNAAVPAKGQKTFVFPFTATRPGKYTIPPVNFSYFDVAAQAYKTLSSPAIDIKVTKGIGTRQAPSHLATASANPDSAKNRLTWVALLAVIGLFLGGAVIWYIRRSGKNVVPATTTPSQGPLAGTALNLPAEEVWIKPDPLQKVADMLRQNDTDNFYYTLNNCLRAYLADKLNFPEKELSRKKINELLDKHNVSIGSTLLLSTLLENVELHLYAPASAEQLQKVFEDAREVVALLDKQVG